MKSLLHFSAILFIFTIGVSCTSSDDDFMTPAPTPNPTPVVNTPTVNTPTVNTPVVNTPAVNTPVVHTPLENTLVVTTVDATFKADLKPITGVTSMASGNVTLQLDKITKIIEINIVFSGTEPYQVIVRRANGTLVYSYTPYYVALVYYDEYIPFSSPAHFGAALSDADIAELMNNQFYLVLSTLAYPDGEIRGALLKQ